MKKKTKTTNNVHFLTSDESWARVRSTTLIRSNVGRARVSTTDLVSTNMGRAGMGSTDLTNTNMGGERMSSSALALSTNWGGRNSSSLGGGNSGHVISLSLSDFGCVLDLDGSYQIGNGSDGQVIGEDAEATGVGGVGNTDFLAFWVDVSVAADLVAESVTEVSGGLSGMRIAEAGLTELVLCVVLSGGVGRIAVSNGVGGSSGDSGVGGADAGVRIVSTVVSTVELSLCGNSQHQKTGNLQMKNFDRKIFKLLVQKWYNLI